MSETGADNTRFREEAFEAAVDYIEQLDCIAAKGLEGIRAAPHLSFCFNVNSDNQPYEQGHNEEGQKILDVLQEHCAGLPKFYESAFKMLVIGALEDFFPQAMQKTGEDNYRLTVGPKTPQP